MAGLRAGLLSEIVVMSVADAARQQDALGADRAGRRHRDHLDRRHDVAHPRLRPVAARLDQPARAEHDHRPEVRGRSASLRGKSFLEVARRPNLTIDDARRDRARVPVRGAGRRVAGSQRGNSRSRRLLQEREARGRSASGRDRELVRRQFREGRGRPRLHLRGSRAPAPVVISRTDARRSRSSPTSIRSASRSASARSSTPSSACSASVPHRAGSRGRRRLRVIPYSDAREAVRGKVLKGSAKISATSFDPACSGPR